MEYILYFLLIFVVSFFSIFYFVTYRRKLAEEKEKKRLTINQQVCVAISNDYNIWESRHITYCTFGSFMANKYRCNDTVIVARDSKGIPTRVINISDIKDPMDALYMVRQSMKFHRVISATIQSTQAKNGR